MNSWNHSSYCLVICKKPFKHFKFQYLLKRSTLNGLPISRYTTQWFTIPTMHDSCINYAFLCMPWTNWRYEKWSTSHRKLHLIIKIGFDSFLWKQKTDKTTCIFFLPMHILFGRQSHCFFLENKFMQFTLQVDILYCQVSSSQIIFVLFWHVPKNTHKTSGLTYALLCVLILYCSGMFQKIHT